MDIIRMSVTGGILIGVIAVIRAIALNKLPKSAFLMLWGVVLCRLLLPFNFTTRLSFYSIVGRIAGSLGPEAAGADVVNAVNKDSFIAGMTRAMQAQRSAGNSVSVGSVVMIVWLVGFVICLTFMAAAYYRNRKELNTAVPIRGNRMLDEWLEDNRLLRSVEILQSDRISTPVATGIIRPRIILPMGMNLADEQLMSYVLTHELLHLKRFDMLWKLVLNLALCIHWFNPMVWIMWVLANRDLELSCDEWVVRHFGGEARASYALSLITMAEQRRDFRPLYSCFNKNSTEERIVSIMKYRRATAATIVFSIVLVITSFVFVGSYLMQEEGAEGTANSANMASKAPATGDDIGTILLKEKPNTVEDYVREASLELQEMYDENNGVCNVVYSIFDPDEDIISTMIIVSIDEEGNIKTNYPFADNMEEPE